MSSTGSIVVDSVWMELGVRTNGYIWDEDTPPAFHGCLMSTKEHFLTSFDDDWVLKVWGCSLDQLDLDHDNIGLSGIAYAIGRNKDKDYLSCLWLRIVAFKLLALKAL